MSTPLNLLDHLTLAPVLLPFATGLLLLSLRGQTIAVQRGLSGLGVLLQVVAAVALLLQADTGLISVYRLGDWPAPWGIVLVADRLAAWMVLITSLLALWVVLHASDGTDNQGSYFHVLVQLQLFGLYGAFLTGDLFNLFVFFEVLLIASYSLMLHGGGAARVRAGLHYVVLNLLGSAVFLLAAGLIYASMGSLNLADLAAKAAHVTPDNLGLARTGGLLLLVVFALKAALLPLSLWLPGTYAAAPAPVAALFAIMTKVGAYAILRVATLIYGDSAGALAQLFAPWLLPAALATLAVSMLGALAAQDLRRLAAWLVVASVGTLLTAFSLGQAGVAAGLYYLPHGTFAAALLFLLAKAFARRRSDSQDRFLADQDMPHHALWGGLFFAAAVAVAGLPPLSGFVGKFLILRASSGQPVVWAVILLTAVLALVTLAHAGSRLFFSPASALATHDPRGLEPASVHLEALAIIGLLGLIVALTVAAGPAYDYALATAAQLADPAFYVHAVLGGKP